MTDLAQRLRRDAAILRGWWSSGRVGDLALATIAQMDEAAAALEQDERELNLADDRLDILARQNTALLDSHDEEYRKYEQRIKGLEAERDELLRELSAQEGFDITWRARAEASERAILALQNDARRLDDRAYLAEARLAAAERVVKAAREHVDHDVNLTLKWALEVYDAAEK